jgi:hypothetical protein
MISATRLGLAFSLVSAILLGCAPESADNAGEAQGASSKDTSACASRADLSFVQITRSVAAKTPDQYNPEFKTCDTNLQIVQVAGTKHDEAINLLLGSDLTKETACDEPETADGSVTVKYFASDILTTAGSSSWYSAGAAHPSEGTSYRNIDLQTGNEIKLSDLVTEQARDTIVRSIKAQIGAQKDVALDDKYEAIMKNGKLVMKPLDAAVKSSLLEAVDRSFVRDYSDKKPELAEMKDFAISKAGIRFDFSNHLPHAMQALEATYLVKYKTLEGKLATSGPITRILPAAKP